VTLCERHRCLEPFQHPQCKLDAWAVVVPQRHPNRRHGRSELLHKRPRFLLLRDALHMMTVGRTVTISGRGCRDAAARTAHL
jgi:hypothetical protein